MTFAPARAPGQPHPAEVRCGANPPARQLTGAHRSEDQGAPDRRCALPRGACPGEMQYSDEMQGRSFHGDTEAIVGR